MSPHVRRWPSRAITALVIAVEIAGLLQGVRYAHAASRFNPPQPPHGNATSASPTIDLMVTFGRGPGGHAAGGPLILLGTSLTYFLSDGSSFENGAGSAPLAYMTLDQVVVTADSVHYIMRAPSDSIAFYRLDEYTEGALAVAGPLVLSAALGSNVAVMSGVVRILENVPISRGVPGFRYFSSRIANVVPFAATYSCTSPWTATSFDSTFTYELAGRVDFAHPIPPVDLQGVVIRGPRRILAPSRTPYTAWAHYPGNLWIDVSSQASWSVSGDSRAAVQEGLVTVDSLGAGTTSFRLQATLADFQGELTVTASGDPAEGPGAEWPMYQADARHTGYRPVTIDPAAFVPRWTSNLGVTAYWSIAAAEDKVFCLKTPGPTLVALDRATGATLWSHEFQSMFYVGPPSYADGSVYVQTSTASDMYVWAFDAGTGALQFHSKGFTQFGVFLAPTIADGRLYTTGGSFDGAYSVDAVTGDNLWMNDRLAQYDRWAAAVDSAFIYVFMNPSDTRLYAIDRASGALAYTIVDTDPYVLNPLGSSSPVLGSPGRAYAVSRGRLRGYDLVSHAEAWTLNRNFIGQPAFANGVIYSNDGGALTALDELTHTVLWSWRPPAGSLIDGIVVTNSHAFVSNGGTTYAIDLASHEATWSYPAGGILAIAERMLYIVTPAGILHAIEQTDLPTPTLLRRFDGVPEATGVRLTWEFEDPLSWTHPRVERSSNPSTGWNAVDAPITSSGGVSQVLDAAVEPGAHYGYRLRATGLDGHVLTLGTIDVTAAIQFEVATFDLNGPNPTHEQVQLAWTLPRATRVQIRMLDLQGRVVLDLLDESHAAGRFSTRRSLPARLPPSVYLLVFRAGNVVMTRRLVVCR